MSSLTDELLKNRRFFSRYKGFILPAAVVLMLGVNIAVGVYLYERYQSEASGSQVVDASCPLPGSWLIKYFGHDRVNDFDIGGCDGDPDEDILTNLQEFYFNTNPTLADTDEDGQWDSTEIAINSNPLGDGPLYSTDYAQSVADRYLEDQRLDEFKQENIEKAVLGLLNPPDPEAVELPLPNISELTVVSDDSPAAVEQYLTEANAAVEGLDYSMTQLQSVFDQPLSNEAQIVLGQIYENVDRLRAVRVPVPFVTFHQLHLAGLLASARLFELAKTIDPLADLDSQQDKIQQQYYQVAVIQKADEMLRAEGERLRPRYAEVMARYE